MSETLTIFVEKNTIIRILLLGFLSFMISMVITPIYTTFAYHKQLWKKQRTEGWDGQEASVYKQLHAEKHKRNIPTMAGVVFVLSILFVTLFTNLDRSQTWLPLAGMVGAGLIGLFDDWMNIRSHGKGIAGMRAKIKFALHSLVRLAMRSDFDLRRQAFFVF